LGSGVFWTQPAFEEMKARGVEDSAESHPDGRVERTARLTIFFFSEVILS
jgi:hypothetical protein